MVTMFVVLGCLIASLIWIFQRRVRFPLAIMIVLTSIIVMAIFLVGYFTIEPITLSEKPWYNTSPYLEVTIFLLMIFGMISRYFAKAIEERREKIIILRKKEGDNVEKPGIEFDAWEFAYPMFFSVITYGLLIVDMKDPSLSLSNAVLSFQTGFLWQTLVSKRLKE